MNKINKMLNKSSEDINLNDVILLSKNEEALKIFSEDLNTGFEFFKDVFNNNKDKDVVREIKPLFYDFKLKIIEKELGSFYRKFEKDKNVDTLLKSLDEYISSDDFLKSISASIVYIIGSINGLDLTSTKYLELLKNNLKELEKLIYALEMETSFPIICELIDLLYSFRNLYFNKYNIDIMDDTTEIQEYIKKLNDFAEPLYKKLEDEAKNIVEKENINPEDMGFIDITKLNK